MDFLKTVANVASNVAQTYYKNYTNQQKLKQQLKTCTYKEDVKLIIQKAVKQLLNVYPEFTSQLLQFSQKGQMKRYLEVKSNLQIQIRGNKYKVDYFMMLPVNYPKKAPYVRIVNSNNEVVAPYYQSLRSPNDPKSFILNQKLNQCKSWDENKSIVNIVIQSQNILRQNFPFVKQNQNWNNYGYNQNNAYNNFNQYGGNNANYGFVNPNTNFNAKTNANTNTNTNTNTNNYNNNNNIQKRPPIPFNTTNSNQLISNSQQFVNTSKKIFEKLKTEQKKSIQKIQYLEAIKSSLESEQQYLRHQNIKMNNFIRNSQNSSIQDIQNLIRPKDQKSEQILNLTSSIRAHEDCLAFLQTKFNEGEIGFEEFIRMARKIEEEKFQVKFLMVKCIQHSK